MHSGHWGGISPRRLLRRLFRLEELPVPPLAPLVLELAARVAQVKTEQLWHDPELMASAHRRCHGLLGHPVVVPALQAGLELAAATALLGPDGLLPGAPGRPRVPGTAGVYLEATVRLRATLADHAALAGAVTGPWTLAHRLARQQAGDPEAGPGPGAPAGDGPAALLPRAEALALAMARGLGEAGVDLVLVAEEEPLPAGPEWLKRLAPVLEAIWNTLRYYNVWPVLTVARGAGLGCLAGWPGLAPGGVLFLHPAGDPAAAALAAQEGDTSWLDACRDLRDRQGVAVGFGISPDAMSVDLAGIGQLMRQARSVLGERGWFLSTSGEIPADVAFAGLLEGFNALRGWHF